MKAYKVTLLIIDFDELGPEGIKDTLQNTRYPNRCLSPTVQDVQVRDIGEWTDDHPLNYPGNVAAEYKRLFGDKDKGNV